MRPNRADSALSQYFCSLLTAVLLLVSLLCGLIFFATTRTFAVLLGGQDFVHALLNVAVLP